MKYIFFLFLLFSSIYAKGLVQPDYTYKISSGLVTDILYNKQKLYCAADDGKIEVFNTKSKKKIQTIRLDKIKDFMGDEIDSKIFSLDMFNGSLLILSQDNGGYSRVHLFDATGLHVIISGSDRLNIIKAKFIDKDNILIALISNDIISYNIKSNKKNWTTQASMSKFSNFALNNDKSLVAIADESGIVHILATKDGAKTKTLRGQNVDNIFSIDFKRHVVLTGGQDRRAGVYNLKNGDAYYKTSKFFVYGVGLSPSGNLAAYSSDINNDVEVFNTNTREILGKYKATKMVVNSIYFINEKEFFINSSSPKVGYYKIK
ncbi:WD40 repeat domain-containing protein [Sulfurimonas autotrophica]|uniref:Periplasmic nitrate reductase assembly and/or export protein NapL n=1 Tax=Sulfurimonas autotrophica (strain ATCC BAA-671 / DSM 16294 / JCM 11897 / OK10) TaxID=563040 RepID=E0UT53_SULAO|nr:WD40 repeat domain-containing protein [Sulfurimonas autotrophica]ADN09294.1 periplasmic nitrate reductase assembly and/or export protein NapL [Sulfurimonas autotrophica DSM 16294]